jgi:hypothetical protein
MDTLLRIVIGFLLIAHGLVHLLYLTDDVPEFSLEGSWLITASTSRSVALVLMWATIVAFTLVGLAVWDVPGLTSVWPALAIVGSALSLLLLVAFWSWSLVFGVLINVAIIAIAVVRPEWTDRIGG